MRTLRAWLTNNNYTLQVKVGKTVTFKVVDSSGTTVILRTRNITGECELTASPIELSGTVKQVYQIEDLLLPILKKADTTLVMLPSNSIQPEWLLERLYEFPWMRSLPTDTAYPQEFQPELAMLYGILSIRENHVWTICEELVRFLEGKFSVQNLMATYVSRLLECKEVCDVSKFLRILENNAISREHILESIAMTVANVVNRGVTEEATLRLARFLDETGVSQESLAKMGIQYKEPLHKWYLLWLGSSVLVPYTTEGMTSFLSKWKQN